MNRPQIKLCEDCGEPYPVSRKGPYTGVCPGCTDKRKKKGIPLSLDDTERDTVPMWPPPKVRKDEDMQ